MEYLIFTKRLLATALPLKWQAETGLRITQQREQGQTSHFIYWKNSPAPI